MNTEYATEQRISPTGEEDRGIVALTLHVTSACKPIVILAPSFCLFLPALASGVQLRDFLGLVMQHLYIVRDENEYIDIEKIARQEIPEEEEYMGTIAEMLERRGREQGIIIGEQQGIQQGKIEATQNLIIENLAERFDVVGPNLTGKIKAIDSLDTLQALFRQTHRVQSIEEFKVLLGKAAED